MDIEFFSQLNHDHVLDAASLQRIKEQEEKKLFSVNLELKTLLSLGILLFTSGISIFIYKNIDSIGHIAIITLIGILMTACFAYCFKTKPPYSTQKTEDPNIGFSYVLLLGALLLLTFIGYVQFQYHVFGSRWGLATFIPAILLFTAAYYFDNIAVLSLAITNLAAWIGLAVTPLQLLNSNDFTNNYVIYSGILFGIFLLGLTLFSLRTNIKAHFALTYKNFGVHLLFIAILAAIFTSHGYYLLWFLLLAAVTAYEFLQSLRLRSFYFLLFTAIYGYIGASFVVVRLLLAASQSGEGGFNLISVYFIFSAVGMILLLARCNKQIHSNDRIQ